MMDVYHEQLPNSYLLIARSIDQQGPEQTLERALFRASQSGKPAVWLDCSLLTDLSAEALEVLLAYQVVLHRHGQALVLSHVSPAVRTRLLSHRDGASLPLRPSLLDAA
mgnify:CR=1 FL=1